MLEVDQELEEILVVSPTGMNGVQFVEPED